MATVIGAIVDVSRSMQQNAGLHGARNEEKWASSIFKVMDNLIEKDVSSENQIFTIGIGAQDNHPFFDVINTIKECNSIRENRNSYRTTHAIIEDIFNILIKSGARTLHKWASIDSVAKHVENENANMILKYLQSDDKFKNEFVNDYLPEACRDWKRPPSASIPILGEVSFGFLTYGAQSVYSSVASSFKQASDEDIKRVKENAIAYIKRAEACKYIQPVNSKSVVSVHKARKILHGVDGGNKLTESRIKELMRSVEKFIYGDTPLYQSLDKANELFLMYQNHKLLFILSDGMPSDGGNLPQIVAELKSNDITVVCCFITSSQDVEPHTLYSEADGDWEGGANFMFKLSSAVQTQKLPRTLFAKRKWTIHFKNNETKLFVQVNHPDHIKDVCKLAHDVVFSKDALVDILADIDLEQYMYQSLHEFTVKKQKKNTCYAHAIACIIHLALKRKFGQICTSFADIRDEIVDKYGQKGGQTLRVLSEFARKNALHSRSCKITNAMDVVASNRPVLARFALTKQEWEIFTTFFDKNKKGTLTKKDLDISDRCGNIETLGHAVVLTSYNAECLRFMNSWGMEWADMGFFRVENDKVLNIEFMDVYGETDDSVEAYSKQRGSKKAHTLMEELKGLHTARCKCPECNETFNIKDFSGTLAEVKCPNGCKFHSNQTEDILALNIYLSSLITKD